MATKHRSFIQRLILKKRLIFWGFLALVIGLWLIDVWYFFAVDIKDEKWHNPLFLYVVTAIVVVIFIYEGFKKVVDRLDRINSKNYRSLKGAEGGFEGEECVKAELEKIFKNSEHKIYHNLELKIEERKFDIDFVIISPLKGVIVLEVKRWTGKSTFYGKRVKRIDKNGKASEKWGKKDPRNQLKNNVRDLKSYLDVHGLAKLHISKAVVIVGGESTVKDSGGVYIVNKIEELKVYVDSIYNKNLTSNFYQRLIKTMDKLRGYM